MRRSTCAVLLLTPLALAGCGTSAKSIDTPTLLRALKTVGFRNLVVIDYRKRAANLAKELHRPELAKNVPDEDAILTRGYTNPVAMPLSAARLPSAALAARRFENDQPLLQGKALTASEREAIPKGYERTRLREVRICNIVMSSYNPSLDPGLTKRFNRAASLLRQNC